MHDPFRMMEELEREFFGGGGGFFGPRRGGFMMGDPLFDQRGGSFPENQSFFETSFSSSADPHFFEEVPAPHIQQNQQPHYQAQSSPEQKPQVVRGKGKVYDV